MLTCECVYLWNVYLWGSPVLVTCASIYLWGAGTRRGVVRAVGVFTCGVHGLVGVRLGL